MTVNHDEPLPTRALFSSAFFSRAILGAALIAAHAGCSGEGSSGTGGGSSGPAWQTVENDVSLGAAALAAWGTGPSDVYVVGGPLGDPGGASLALHFDGERWTKMPVSGADSFWWVTGSSKDDVWMVGEKGRVTRWDGSAFIELPRPATSTIWGVWAAGPDDAYVVSGTPGKGVSSPNDLIFHWDGKGWTQQTLPGPPRGASINKIWGASPGDVYAVGEQATIWHLVGSSWQLEPAPEGTSNLFSVSGCSATDIYAAGGDVLLHSDGKTWSRVTSFTIAGTADGVYCVGPGEVLVVGFGGMKARLSGGEWHNDFKSRPYDADFHGAWADGEGALWALGGDFLSGPHESGDPRRATIGRYARDTIAPIPF
ncbi:MAG: hypothetical protein U0359_14870 [Byssovorax sp.]